MFLSEDSTCLIADIDIAMLGLMDIKALFEIEDYKLTNEHKLLVICQICRAGEMKKKIKFMIYRHLA